MNFNKGIQKAFIIGLAILAFGVYAHAQEAESKTVVFEFKKAEDNAPPSINLISPILDEDQRVAWEKDRIDVLGEVVDASKIRFISVNNDIQMANETGVFASSVRLKQGENEIRLKSMDEHSNLNEVVFYVDYQPPVITLEQRIRESSEYYGLIIGIDDYDDPNIVDLDNPVRDARNVYDALTTYYTFDPENISVLENPSRGEIIRELDMLRKRVTSEDNLLIFYAGHGYWDEEAEIGYWLPSDASKETTADWFRNSTLVNYLQAIDSRHTLLITDACFAGSIFKSRSVNMAREMAYDRIFDTPSRKAMTSGALTEVPDKSAFVKYLVRRLEDNEETYLSSEELFSSFKMAVISNSSNGVLPLYGEIQNVGNEGGDFIFLKRDEE